MASSNLHLGTGYAWDEISSCIYWMAPYALTLREAGPVEVKTFPQIPLEDTHNIQSHNVDLTVFVSDDRLLA